MDVFDFCVTKSQWDYLYYLVFQKKINQINTFILIVTTKKQG